MHYVNRKFSGPVFEIRLMTRKKALAGNGGLSTVGFFLRYSVFS